MQTKHCFLYWGLHLNLGLRFVRVGGSVSPQVACYWPFLCGVSCSIVSYLYVSCSGSIISVGEERVDCSAILNL